jgi:hypothetical protein
MVRTLVSTALIATALLASPARAEDEFGCKVLLCAAAENPSWRGIPYCVPVMAKLYSMMNAWSFSWPICSSAGTGAPGYDPYLPCPAGFTPRSNDDGNRGSAMQTGHGNQMCVGMGKCSDGGRDNNSAFGHSNSCQVSIPRPVRSDPYYFDIPEHKRVYFAIQ